MKAAVLWNVSDPVVDVLDDVELVEVGPQEVRVRLAASGLCQTDISAMNGSMPTATPAVLGHEGAGVVVEVGTSVETVSLGQHVVLSYAPPCGRCRFCQRGQANLCIGVFDPFDIQAKFTIRGEPGTGLAGLGTWAQEVIVPFQAAVPIPEEIPLDIASLLGCAVITGVGAALNTASIRPGDVVAVVGCGGIGLSIIQGAKIAGAAEIIAVDPAEERREAAQRLGATRASDPIGFLGMLDHINGGDGADHVFEAVGRSSTIRDAFDATRKGGETIVVGAGSMEDEVVFSAFELFYYEKTLKGCFYGSSDARTDFGRLLDLWQSHELDLEGLISHRLGIDDINDGLNRMRQARGVRQLIVYAG